MRRNTLLNPNAYVKELKAIYGNSYNYRFLELDILQRDFHFMITNREKQTDKQKKKKAKRKK